MRKIPLSRNQFALVDDDDYDWLMQWKWYADAFGYALRHGKVSDGERNRKNIWMHREIMQAPQGMDVDHINMNRLDNRKENLRICDRSRNKGNVKKRRDGRASRFKGVGRARHTQLWRARITKNGREMHLGWFDTEIEAALAYDAKAREIFGVFARTNFPPPISVN